MNGTGLDGPALGEAFRNPPGAARAGEGCPPGERILDAVLGRAPRSVARELADHAATCPACSVAWRLARDYSMESDLLLPRDVRSNWRRLAVVAAFAAIAIVGVLWMGHDTFRGPAEPGYRALPYETIDSLVEDAPLPASAFTLRWGDAGEGARYVLRVTDARLTEIVEVRSLSDPEYTVPAEALAGLEPGDVVLWQVEVRRADGGKTVSPTFAVRLE